MNGFVLNRSVPLALRIADLAVRALVDEAELTPKPGLVDQRGSGAHRDLTLDLMRRSAHALYDGFARMGEAAAHAEADLALREAVGRIGREAEADMMRVTGGVNTHRGAIWALGLLSAAAAMQPADLMAANVARRAASLACLADRFSQPQASNGERMRTRYGVPGARGEAQQAFPHVIDIGLPALRASRAAGQPEDVARLDALIAILARLHDTCVLSRGGEAALRDAQSLARDILRAGGTGSLQGQHLLYRLELNMLAHNASPGGAADLLAATLFLDALERQVTM
ncbi:triphosphoribosyl-dephospho-CoA synthase [Microvirgula sp. AG722]|uniref:triphosphoribosyl-dephospho-CoA synthase n=1 Tax=Microvirgula sp. AG722 TaxID=2183901 RepID=UPI000DC36D90|nr:triphosphoribosyl-dephospho-CoA synthase [Microvirgula sp. AG722]RAS15704.1 triphosphoribosyl-dephospho-CoA synthase [Microvirgula sp. AG722]